MGKVRRALSVVIVKSNSLCLLERLLQFGPGARRAGERRRVVLAMEARWQQKAHAYSIAKRQRGLPRVRRTFIPSQ